MVLSEQLLKEHSRANCDKIVKWIGKDQARFDELYALFTGNQHRLVQHAAWPISYAVIAHPELINKHYTHLINNLAKPNLHAAVKRNTLRLLQEIDIPKKHHGKLMDACFRFISTPCEAVAIKAFSLTVLERLAKIYPDIIPEVKLLIEENYDRETAAFKQRANRFIKQSGR